MIELFGYINTKILNTYYIYIYIFIVIFIWPSNSSSLYSNSILFFKKPNTSFSNLFLSYLFSFYYIIKTIKTLLVYCVKLTEIYYSTCISLLFCWFWLTFICKSLWIKTSTKWLYIYIYIYIYIHTYIYIYIQYLTEVSTPLTFL